MHAMTVRTIPASDAHVRTARAFLSHAAVIREFGIGALLIIGGVGGIVLSLAVTQRAFVGVFIGVGACVAVAMGIFRLFSAHSGRAVTRQFSSKLSGVLERREVVEVQLDIDRAFLAPSIDDDAPALVLTDGQGGGLYINSQELYELEENLPPDAEPEDPDSIEDDESPIRIPRRIRAVLSARSGMILELTGEGEPIIAAPGPGTEPFDFSAVDETNFQAVVLPTSRTAKAWAQLLSAGA
jgi:hypothetical protein